MHDRGWLLVQGQRQEWVDHWGRDAARQDCNTPQGVQQFLCERADTTTMCRLYEAQSSGASAHMPSLGNGVTIFVMVDAAISRLKYMSRDSRLGVGLSAAPMGVDSA